MFERSMHHELYLHIDHSNRLDCAFVRSKIRCVSCQFSGCCHHFLWDNDCCRPDCDSMVVISPHPRNGAKHIPLPLILSCSQASGFCRGFLCSGSISPPSFVDFSPDVAILNIERMCVYAQLLEKSVERLLNEWNSFLDEWKDFLKTQWNNLLDGWYSAKCTTYILCIHHCQRHSCLSCCYPDTVCLNIKHPYG